MEKLQIEVGGVWHHIEVLRWMERNTRLFVEGAEYTIASPMKRWSEQRIAELVGKVVRR